MDAVNALDPLSKRHVHGVSNRRKYFLKKGSFRILVPNVLRKLLPENMNVFNFEDSILEELVCSKCKDSSHVSDLVSSSPASFPRKIESSPDCC